MDTTHVEVKIKNDADDSQLIISKKEPSQTHLNGHKENNNNASKEVLVNYELNKKSALAKKMGRLAREKIL